MPKYKPRLIHAKYKLENQQPARAKRMLQNVQLCGASLNEYNGMVMDDRDEEMLKYVFVRENISCSSKIELPYLPVEHLPRVCIYIVGQ